MRLSAQDTGTIILHMVSLVWRVVHTQKRSGSTFRAVEEVRHSCPCRQPQLLFLWLNSLSKNKLAINFLLEND